MIIYKNIKELMKKEKNKKGITLIALVITVIIMLILAGVAINALNKDDGLFSNVRESEKRYSESALEEEKMIGEIINMVDINNSLNEDFDYSLKVNMPKLKEGMIPITYDNTKGWVVADKNNTNKEWYDYENKKWANICTVDSEHANYRTANIGTPIPVEEMTTMFVWIPRYAYSIVNGYQTANSDSPTITNASEEKNIEIKFLVGTSNIDADYKSYSTDYDAGTEVINGKTPMIVNPGFKFGTSALTGIWVAKFEASGVDNNGQAVGNYVGGDKNSLVSPVAETAVKVLPSVISWRNLQIGDSQYFCMNMGKNYNQYGWNNVNTHLIKNSEWGIVAYLAYSKYGSVPMINGAGNYNETSRLYYDLYTGAGPKDSLTEDRYVFSNDHAYNTEVGVLASTTGNVYGVYDLAGGSYERLAAYMDNGNHAIGENGNISESLGINDMQYFNELNKLNDQYSAYWDSYEVSEEERNNRIAVDNEFLTQEELWNKSGNDFKDAEVNKKYNTIRKALTDATYNLFYKRKGSCTNEVIGMYSYHGVATTGKYVWMIDVDDTSLNRGRAWNGDTILIGHSEFPFVTHGGYINEKDEAGIFYLGITQGNAAVAAGFRPVICP